MSQILQYATVPGAVVCQNTEEALRIELPWRWALRSHLFVSVCMVLPLSLLLAGIVVWFAFSDRDLFVFVFSVAISAPIIVLVDFFILGFRAQKRAVRVLEFNADGLRVRRASGETIRHWRIGSLPRVRVLHLPLSSFGVIFLTSGYLKFLMTPAARYDELVDAVRDLNLAIERGSRNDHP